MKTKYFESIIQHVKDNPYDYDTTGNQKKCYSFPDYVVLKSEYISGNLDRSKRQLALSRLKKLGFKTPNIVYFATKKHNQFDYPEYFEIQEKAKGGNLFCEKSTHRNLNINYTQTQIDRMNYQKIYNILTAPTEHFSSFVKSMFIGAQLGIIYDAHYENVFYDNKEGFSFIDLPTLPERTFKELEKRVYDFSTFDESEFVKIMDYPFNTWAKYSYNNLNFAPQSPLYNLLHHRFLDGINNCGIPFSEETKKHLKSLLLEKDEQYSTFSDENHSQIVKKLQPVISDYLDLKQTKDNAEDDFDNISSSQYGLEDLYFTFSSKRLKFEDGKIWQKTEKGNLQKFNPEDDHFKFINLGLYLKCLSDCKIDEKPAIEYFEEFYNTANDNVREHQTPEKEI